jgi:hypothetical protein
MLYFEALLLLAISPGCTDPPNACVQGPQGVKQVVDRLFIRGSIDKGRRQKILSVTYQHGQQKPGNQVHKGKRQIPPHISRELLSCLFFWNPLFINRADCSGCAFAGVVGSKLTREMDSSICLFCVCAVLCVGTCDWQFLPSACRIKKLKMRPVESFNPIASINRRFSSHTWFWQWIRLGYEHSN